MLKRKDTRIHQLQDLLEVLVLGLPLPADQLERGIDLIKALAQGLKLYRCFLYLEVAGKIPVMDGLYELFHLLLRLTVEIIKIHQLKNDHRHQGCQVSIYRPFTSRKEPLIK